MHPATSKLSNKFASRNSYSVIRLHHCKIWTSLSYLNEFSSFNRWLLRGIIYVLPIKAFSWSWGMGALHAPRTKIAFGSVFMQYFDNLLKICVWFCGYQRLRQLHFPHPAWLPCSASRSPLPLRKPRVLILVAAASDPDPRGRIPWLLLMNVTSKRDGKVSSADGRIG